MRHFGRLYFLVESVVESKQSGQVFLKRISEERVLNVMETKIIFANIEQLLQMHRELLHDLQKAVQLDLEADTLHNTVDLFLKWVSFFLLYSVSPFWTLNMT